MEHFPLPPQQVATLQRIKTFGNHGFTIHSRTHLRQCLKNVILDGAREPPQLNVEHGVAWLD
jgi:hypothetical protein